MTDFDEEGIGVDIGNPSGYIAEAIRQGLSARAGRAAFREAGGSMRDSRWNALYGQVADTLAREPFQRELNPLSVPSPADYGTWAMGRGGQYATQVTVQVIDRETQDWTTRYYTHVTSDPHTPADAEAAALDEFGDADTENAYGETIMGALASSLWQTVPYSEM